MNKDFKEIALDLVTWGGALLIAGLLFLLVGWLAQPDCGCADKGAAIDG